MRVLVCGDRYWSDQKFLMEKLDEFHAATPITLVIEGCASGADSMAGDHPAEYPEGDLMAPVIRGAGWARVRNVLSRHFPADWKTKHRSAGPQRNQQMLVEGKPEYGIAFHDDLGNSAGTADMVGRLRRAGISVRVYSHAGQYDLEGIR